MAIRFNGTSDVIQRTSSVPSHDANYSLSVWVYLINAPSGGACILSIDDATDDVDEYYIDSTRNLNVLTLVGGSPTNTAGTTALSLSTWYHIGIVRAANNSRIIYLNGVQEVNHTASVSARTAASSMSMGTVLGSDLFDGRMANPIVWTTNLTQAQIQLQQYSAVPVTSASIYSWARLLDATDLGDLAGGNHGWTAGGTLTTEDGPGIAWNLGPARVFVPASGTAYTQDTSGTLTSAGAITKQANKVAAGTLTSAGAMVRSVAKSVAGTLTTAGAAIKQTAKSLAGTLTTAGALVSSRLYSLAVTGTLTTAGALARQTNKLAAGTLTTAGSLARSIAKVVAGTLTTAGTLARSTAKSLAGALTTAGALVADFVTGGPTYTQAVEGTLATAGTLSRSTSKALAGTLTTAGAITRQIAKSLAGTLATVGALLRDWISPSAAKLDVTLTDARIYTCTLTDARTYTCTVADALAYTVTLGDSTT